MKNLLKNINKTGDVARKVESGQHKSVPRGENNNLLNKMTFSHMKLTQITRELKIDCRSVFHIIDHILDDHPLRKWKVQKHTD